MIKIRFRREWTPAISDWDDDFDPCAYEWVVEDGRWHNSHEFVDIRALNAPKGEWLRIGRAKITLTDIINLYDSDLSSKSDAYGYNEKGEWVFNNDAKFTPPVIPQE